MIELGRIHMKRNLAGWATALALGLLVPSCGGVEVLGDAPAGGAGTGGTHQGAGGTASVGGSSDHACETACVRELFNEKITPCKLCHGAATQLGALDLESPNVTARLKDVPARHTDFLNGMGQCPIGDKLIDTATPDASWLLRKIRGQQGSCGTPMPQTGLITAAQSSCIEAYVHCVAGG